MSKGVMRHLGETSMSKGIMRYIGQSAESQNRYCITATRLPSVRHGGISLSHFDM